MHALFMANAPFPSTAEAHLRVALPTAALLIGVDGGARTLLRLGFVPNVVTGDGDSLTEAERAALQAMGACLIPTPDQDFTDLDKALTVAMDSLGITEATVFGATGGRLDHSYSVFSTLLKHGPRLPLRLVDEQACYQLVAGELVLTGDDLVGRTLSLLAFGRVEGITTTGVRWPLTDDWLAPGLRDGTLNEITEPRVRLTARSGPLIAMVHHGALP